MSNIYYAGAETRHGDSIPDKVDRLFDRAGLGDLIKPGDLVALKLHIGEPGNLAYIPPPLVRRVVEKVRARGGKPYLTDANTLYVGRRANAVDHTLSALENGFSYATVGAPFIVADGLRGREYVLKKIAGRRLREVRIAAALAQADVIIALTHFKGHQAAGFGGAFKNLGMGGASRTGKQEQHSDIKPKVSLEACIGCRKCERWCPTGAIVRVEGGKAFIEEERCIGCAECTITCQDRAIAVNWREGDEGALQEKMVEYTLGVIQAVDGRVGYLNFLLNISPDCDCLSWNEPALTPNLGILAGLDPVAIDQASYDLVQAAPSLSHYHGSDKFQEHHPGIDGTRQLRYAEELGLGQREYQLQRLP